MSKPLSQPLSQQRHRDTLRALTFGTALAGSLFAFAGTATAQNTPDTPTVVVGTNVDFTTNTPITVTGNGGGGALTAIDGSATALTVNLGTNLATIINWNKFDISSGSSTAFQTALGGQVAVLNRVTGGTPSTLAGTLSSANNINVFLLNPNGILVSSSGAVSTGSFVASTLGLSDSDFLGGSSYNFTSPANATAGITVQSGAMVSTAGGERGLVLVAPRIISNGNLDAGSQDVAFVTATDTRLTFTPGSPLGIVINRGTAVPGASQVIGGVVNGQNAYFALASQAGVNDALLQIDANVTTAVASDRGIVLIAGPSLADPHVQVAGNVDTSGTAHIAINGSLSNSSTASGIFARASGDIASSGTLDTRGTVSLGALGSAGVTGPVTAGGDYELFGQSVTLGGVQSAAGAVSITANGGAISNSSALTLTANSDGSGSEALKLTGIVALGTNSSLFGGFARQSDVIIDTASANGLSLGNVTANAVSIASGGLLDGAIVTGDLATNAALGLRSNQNITTGALNASSALIEARNSIATIGAITLTGSLGVIARGIAFSTIDANGVTLNAYDPNGTGITGTRITSSGAVDLNATTGTGGITIGAITTTAGALTATSIGDITLGTVGVTGGTTYLTTQTNPADIVITGGLTGTGNVTLNSSRDVAAVAIGSTGATTINAASGRITGIGAGAANLSAGGMLSVNGGTLARLGMLGGGSIYVSANQIVAGSALATPSSGVVDLNAGAGGLGVSGVVNGGAVTLHSLGTTQLGGAVTGQTVDVSGTTGMGFATIGGTTITIGSTGGAVTGTSATATGALSVTGQSVGIGTITSTNGPSSVTATAGNVLLNGITSGGTTNITASATARVFGPVSVTGDYSVRGQDVALSGTQSATGAVTIFANNGAITNPAALTLTANSDGVGAEALRLTGGIALGLDSSLNGGFSRQSDVVIDTAPADGITIGDVNANALSIASGGLLGGAIVTGNLHTSAALSLRSSQNVTTGTLTASSAAVEAVNSTVSTQAVSVSGSYSANGSRIDFTTIDAGSVYLGAFYAGGTGIGGTRITASGPIQLDATSGTGGIAIGTVTTTNTGALTANSVGTIMLGTVTVAGTTDLRTQTNPADIMITGGLTGTGSVTLNASRDVLATAIGSTSDALTINALNGSVSGIAGGRANLSALNAVTVRGGALAQLGTITGGSIDIAADRIVASSATATPGTGSISLIGGANGLTVDNNVNGGVVTLHSSGTTTLGGAINGTIVDVNGASVDFNAITGGSATISGGTITGTGASVTNALTVNGGSVTIATLASTNGAIDARATAGTLQLGSVTSGGSILLDQAGAGTLGVGAVIANGVAGNVTLRSDGDMLATGAIVGNAAVSLTSSSNIGALSAQAGTTLTLTALSGAITGLGATGRADLSAGGLVQVRGGLLARLGALSGGAIDVTAGQILASSALATPTSGSVSLVAGAGGLDVGGTVNGGAVTLRSLGVTSLGGSVNGQTVDVRGTTSVGFTAITGANTAAITGGAVTGASASGINGLTVSGSSVTIANLSAANGVLSVMATNGALGFTTASGQSATLTQTGIGTLSGASLTTTGGALTVTSDGTMTLGTVTGTGGATSLTTNTAAGDIVITGTVGGTGPVALLSAHDIQAQALTSGGNLSVTAAAGQVTGIGAGRVNLNASGAIGVTAGTLARLGTIDGASISIGANQIIATYAHTNPGTGGITMAAGSGGLRVDQSVLGGPIALSSSGTTSLGGLVSGTTVGVSGAGIDFVTITGSNTTTITGGTVSGGDASGTNGLTVAGSDMTFGSLGAANGVLNATATNGTLTFAAASARSATLTQTGTGGINGTTLTTTNGALVTQSAGTTTLGTVSVTGGTAQLSTTTATGDIIINTSVTGSGDVTLTSGRDVQAASLVSGGILRVDALAGQVTGIGAGRANLSATGLVRVRAGSLARLGTIGGASIDVGANQIIATSASTTPAGGGITLAAGNGGLTVDNAGVPGGTIVTGGAVTLSSTGATSLSGTVGGTIVTVSGSTIGFTTITGSSSTTITGGAVTGTSASGTNSLTIGGSAISIGSATSSLGNVALNSTGMLSVTTAANARTGLTAMSVGNLAIASANVTAGNALITSTGGNALLNTATVSGNLNLNAVNGTATAPGAIAIGGNYAIRGGSVAIGGNSGLKTQTAAGTIDIIATTGTITGGADLILTTTGGTGSTIALDAAQGITFGGGGTIVAGTTGNAAIGLRAGMGQAIDLGALVRGSQIVSIDAAHAFGTQLARSGSLTLGQAILGQLNVNLSSGNIQTGALATTGATSLVTTGNGTITTGTIGASTITAATGGAISVGASTATGALSLTSSGGNVTATGNLVSGGATTIGAGGTANLQAVTASPSITITAADAELNGAVSATTVNLINSSPSAGMQLGSGSATSGFRLSQTEINRIAATNLTIDGGTGAVGIGALALATTAGSGRFDVLTTGNLTVTGTVSSPATSGSRTIRFGGTAAATGSAQSIRIVTVNANGTAAAIADGTGGALLFAGSTLDLRADRIAAGDLAFINRLFPMTPLSGAQAAAQFVSFPNSALYNTRVDNVTYQPGATTVLSATNLTVTYGNFALFQNTGSSSVNLGAVLGGTVATPVNTALTLQGPGTTIPNSFALFGTINGIGGTATSTLAGTVILTAGIDPTNSRINGCLIGTGAGCLNSPIAQPSLNVFDASRLDVFRSADDFNLPFDPIVGSNNEALFAGIAAIDLPPPPDCEDDATRCPAPQENKQ